MKKFKKIAALIVATVTLAAMSINACAAQDWLELCFNRGHIEATYYRANNMFHYYDSWNYYDRHIITFSGMDKSIMEGNIVLTVDFDDEDKLTALEYDQHCKASQFVGSLYLKDTKGNFITEGKYPLTTNYYNAPDGCLNIMVDTNWRVFQNFDIVSANYNTNLDYINFKVSDKDCLLLGFTIKGICVLPSYNLELREITNSSTPITVKGGEFIQNTCANATERDSQKTVGSYMIEIPTQCRGKSFYVYANGMKLGKVTLPYKSTNSVSYANY